MGREEFLLREVSLKEFKENDKDFWNPPVEMAVGGKKPVNEVDLWAAHLCPGHKWHEYPHEPLFWLWRLCGGLYFRKQRGSGW